jgi:hypothetical protein
MTETRIDPKPHEREHAELDRIMERLDTMADVLDFKDSAESAEARQDLVHQVDGDGRFDETNPEHRALLAAYMKAAEDSFSHDPEPEPAIGYQVALASLWIRLDDPDRYYERFDAAAEMLYRSRLFAALMEMMTIADDLVSLNQNQA